ncbi:bifunctional 2',3'-cyclic nucleotide 2'-phosphodiesterase/3'-nucleotidase precursor protein [Fictibacillus macauensis ZFHKF-1]|uniref:Bifunctional 2',3'-cyclic nucleotide 2'-phosphodiesterase/3'-nucleotidase protein n=1 Tax=Fictibacillus macauensis ZFHKF-1 TaxID=1196324 RepID=I8IW20_9BACL|nr:bifunctional 2',3'-cyclic-nucleotide 2'-phosphodiesterase/3'-nucleotidase [Fictibacillus macauensis]EIT83681.1 bifunctional 2',3'-cyclic nucleotide 2'-phosphodiesterase/3'-nucleotidase precursor protein [Fictibacillus macauensis ZFHKF-1]
MGRKSLGKTSRIMTASALTLSLFASSLGNSPADAAAKKVHKPSKKETVQLRLLGTTDLHANIANYDYYKDSETEEFGLAKTATLIKQARKEAKNTLLFDSGDLIQGTPLGDYKAKIDKLKKGELHPVFKAMKLLNYDAATVGNHEFNYGLPFLKQVLDASPFPYVNANIYKDDHDRNPYNDKNLLKPYQILKRTFVDTNGKKQTVKVGVIGAVAPQITLWDKANLDGKVKTKDIVASVKDNMYRMKRDGADVVVVLAHSGMGDAKYEELEEDTAYQLTKIKGVDAVLSGHNHKLFPGDFSNLPHVDEKNGTVNGKPLIMAGNWGNNLGVIDMNLVKSNGKWSVEKAKSQLRAVYDKVQKKSLVKTDQSIVKAIEKEHKGTIEYVRKPVGTTTAPINSYFSLVQDDPSVQIVTNAQKWYVEKKLKGTKDEGLPVLSAGAPFKAGGRNGASYYTNIAKGTIAIKNVSDLYLYPNTVATVKVKGKDVKEWLEMSAGQFQQIDGDKKEEQALINSNYPTYNFDVIDGVTYDIDVSQPAKYDRDGKVVNENAHRIRNLKYDGKPLDHNQEFIVATNNYRASGSFPGVKNNSEVKLYPDENRQVLIDYITQQKTIDPTADHNWKFAEIPGEPNLTFESSPDAQAVVDPNGPIKYVGKAAEGFAKYSYKMKELKSVDVRFLGVNDFHGQLDTYNQKLNAGGAEYLASYLKERKAENPDNTLMVHAGDIVGASSPMSALLQDEPTIRFFNNLGFDAGTLGNHEFDEGVTELQRLLKGGPHPKTVEKYGPFEGANFPYVAANVISKKTGQPLVAPYVIKEVQGQKIGIIGISLSDTPSVVIPSGVEGVEFTDETEAINKYTKELQGKGIHAIAVIAHVPAASMADGANPTGEMVNIANDIDDDVDVIFAGHNHGFINATVDHKLIVEAYSYGTSFSDVKVQIDPKTHDIVKKSAEIVQVDRTKVKPDEATKAFVDRYTADVAPKLNQVIGKTPAYINKESNEDGESPMGNLIADSMRFKTKTDFSFMNPGGIRADIDAGDITWKEAFTVQPFGNDLVTMELTGAQVKSLLNEQWSDPTRAKILQVSGLKVAYDDSRKANEKVTSVTLPNGTPLDDSKSYTVTVNNFMAGGGDGYTTLRGGKNKKIDVVDLDALIDYIKDKGTIDPKIEGRITKQNKKS